MSQRTNFVPSRAGSASSILQSNNRLGNAFRSDGADHLVRRVMSTTADEELDTALSEILGEAKVENSAPTADEELDTALSEILGEAKVENSAPTADEELDTALGEILGEAISEAENPASLGNNGHIEGSHPFPKELVEEVIAFVCSGCWKYDRTQRIISAKGRRLLGSQVSEHI